MDIEELAIFCCNSFKTTQIQPALERAAGKTVCTLKTLKIPQASACTAASLGTEAFNYVMWILPFFL